MELRELDDADFPALLDLCRQTLTYDQWTLRALELHTRGEPEHNRAWQLALWDDDRLVGAMLGGVRGEGDSRFGVVRLFTIDTAYRRQGNASRLLTELQDRLRAAGIPRLRVGGAAPDYFWPGLDLRYTPAVCMLEKFGFERSGEGINMAVDLHSRDWQALIDDLRSRQPDFTIRRLEHADRAQFSDWLLREWSPAWQYEGLLTYTNDPISTFVETTDDRIVAFASYNTNAFAEGFGPTGTEPAYQGRGLGRILFYCCMQDLKEQGFATAEVMWTGPIAFYARVADAQIHRVFWFFDKEL